MSAIEAVFSAWSMPMSYLEFPQNLRPISLLSTTGKQFEKVILKIVERHNAERGLFHVSQFGFRARHSTTL
jgi:putative lipoic acid-binding regulatory protein